MILEGFEIENWSCIQRVAVHGLPATGIAVLYGGNGTGKSSIVQALRACLMDNKSTSKALDRGFSKKSSHKPKVSVIFRSGATSWRITKQFNSKESRLESRTSTGQWKLETTDPSEAHERARQLTGGCDSTMGLAQLLWLTQAEFRLPDPKKFDADIQSRLRGMLGALQTSLDDRFLGKVKEGWQRWFSIRSKAGKKPDLKDSCSLAKNRTMLEEYRTSLSETEKEFAEVEDMLKRCSVLEINRRELQEQMVTKNSLRDRIQKEYEQSLVRFKTHDLAKGLLDGATKRSTAAAEMQQQRKDKAEAVVEAEKIALAARTLVDEKDRLLQEAEDQLRDGRKELAELRLLGVNLQARQDRVRNRIKALDLQQKTTAARDNLKLAEEASQELEALHQQDRDHAAPDATTLSTLEENRTTVRILRAKVDEALLTLVLTPRPGASALRIIVDGAHQEEIAATSGDASTQRAIRRQVVLELPGWGRAELTRGSDSRSLEELEKELAGLAAAFAEQLAPYGIVSHDPRALETLRQLAADRRVRLPLIDQKSKEIERLAPKGIVTLRTELAQLENMPKAARSQVGPASSEEELPNDLTVLENLAETLKSKIDTNAQGIQTLEETLSAKQKEIDGGPDASPAAKPRRARSVEAQAEKLALRRSAEVVRLAHTDAEATARLLRQQLEQMTSSQEIDRILIDAQADVAAAQRDLDQAKLSSDEETVLERLKIARDGVESSQDELRINEKELHQLTAVLGTKGGLHQRRAEAKGRVEEYARLTERETLESEAYHRLYELFEECRVEQFSEVMRPIHDRVLSWMKLSGIGAYQALQFNDQCLPERLTASDGTYELSLLDESHGTQEQIGVMVRLALGSTLSTPNEPVVAILDDPLTHGDTARLDRMRAILRKAAEGESGISPPAGPLQILVFTCHPERFRKSADMVIDLEDPAVMTRFAL